MILGSGCKPLASGEGPTQFKIVIVVFLGGETKESSLAAGIVCT